jgi:hypothetical protein
MPVVARGWIRGAISVASVCSAPGAGCRTSTGIGLSGAPPASGAVGEAGVALLGRSIMSISLAMHAQRHSPCIQSGCVNMTVGALTRGDSGLTQFLSHGSHVAYRLAPHTLTRRAYPRQPGTSPRSAVPKGRPAPEKHRVVLIGDAYNDPGSQSPRQNSRRQSNRAANTTAEVISPGALTQS